LQDRKKVLFFEGSFVLQPEMPRTRKYRRGEKSCKPEIPEDRCDALERKNVVGISFLPETYATAPFRLFIFFLLIVKSKKVMGCPEKF
jgi:hypothetical protein